MIENVVLLSSCSNSCLHFIRRVYAECPLRAVIRVLPTDESKSQSKTRSNARRWRVGSILRSLERRLIYEHYYRRLDRQVTRQLNAQDLTLPGIDVYPIPDDQVNSQETRKLVQQLSADLLVVHSGPVLDPTLFSTPRYGAINVHYGISPDYRGENTLFWAMYHRDYSKLGITIHKIDSNIDSGTVLCQGFPALSPEDTEVSLCAKATETAATALIDVLHNWNPTTVLPVSQRRGLQFNKRDRRVWHDLKLWSRRNLRRELLPPMPEHFEFNYCRELVTEPE